MEIHTRIAKISDAEAIAELSHQLGYEITTAKTKAFLAHILDDPNSCVFAAVVNEKAIGWVHGFYSMRIESDPFVEIGGLVIHENYRRKGIGKMLVEKIIAWSLLKKNGKLRVRCNTVRKETHKFYGLIGFKEIKEQKVFEMNLI